MKNDKSSLIINLEFEKREHHLIISYVFIECIHY